MKRILNLCAIAATLVLGLASCQVEPEDAFSKAPVAPELYAHNDILITSNTMGEDVTFSWAAYRNLPDGLTYTLYAIYDVDPVELVSTKELFYTWSKEDFKALLYSKIPGLPDNDLFSLVFYVSVTDDKAYKSADVRVNIYANGNAIAPVITLESTAIVLDPADPNGELYLMSWVPARLEYGEEVLYKVAVRVGDQVYVIAEDLTETKFLLTVDELNEAIIAAGGAEDAENEVEFLVTAYCASVPDGATATSETVRVTTYVSTFAEELYLPGSYQGWNPASAPTIPLSSVQKGFYQGIVDLTTADGSDVQFKFSPVPAWEGDFGGKVEVKPTGSGEFPTAVGTVGVSDNIQVPSGLYYIEVDKKQNILRMVQFGTLNLIGSAVGSYDWGQDVELAFDADKKEFSAVTTFKAGEFKMRFNHNWDFSLGGSAETGYSLVGGNIANEKEGEYRIVIDVSGAPFTIKYINTSFPEQLYVPGSHNGWNHSATVFAGNGEGQFEGFANLGGEWGFKFTPAANWDNGEWGKDKNVDPVTDGIWTVYTLTDNNAGNISEGSEVTYCKAIVDLTDLTVRLAPVTSVGIIGGFDGNVWSSDQYPLTYDSASDSWIARAVELSKSVEWKFRMNEDWAINLGGAFDNLTQDGPNLKVAESGTYDVQLFIGTTPYKAVLTKTGGSSEPEYPENMYMIGAAFGNWNWDSEEVVELTPVNGKPGQFWAIRYIEAGSPFKFCGKRAWSGDFNSLGENTGFTVADGNCNVAETSVYMIYVDMANDKLCVEPAKVYGKGDCFGGWSADPVAFAVEGDKVVGTTTGEGELRMYADCSIATSDWWTREFIILDGKIAYRGNGGDQERVKVAGGSKVTLDFNGGTGTIESGSDQPAAGITIDGDMSDWAGVTTGVATEANPGVYQEFKVYNDDNNIYFYSKRDNRAAIWGGSGYFYYDIDADNNAETGVEKDGITGLETWMYIKPFAGSSSAPAFATEVKGDAYPSKAVIANLHFAGVNSDSYVEVEVSVPLADAGVKKGDTILVYSWSNKDGYDVQHKPVTITIK